VFTQHVAEGARLICSFQGSDIRLIPSQKPLVLLAPFCA